MFKYYSVNSHNRPRAFHWTFADAAQAGGFSEQEANAIADELNRLERKFGSSIWKYSNVAGGAYYTYVTVENTKIYIWRKRK